MWSARTPREWRTSRGSWRTPARSGWQTAVARFRDRPGTGGIPTAQSNGTLAFGRPSRRRASSSSDSPDPRTSPSDSPLPAKVDVGGSSPPAPDYGSLLFTATVTVGGRRLRDTLWLCATSSVGRRQCGTRYGSVPQALSARAPSVLRGTVRQALSLVCLGFVAWSHKRWSARVCEALCPGSL